jgi:hypothetical protein
MNSFNHYSLGSCVEWKCDKDRYHITVRADEEVDFYYDFKDREVLSLEMRESILNAVIK